MARRWDADEVESCTYLKVMPETYTTGFFTEIGLDLGPAGSPIPTELWRRLRALNMAFAPTDEYMSRAQFQLRRGHWEQLDREGIDLARAFESHLQKPVRYWSPLHGRFIWRGTLQPERLYEDAVDDFMQANNSAYPHLLLRQWFDFVLTCTRGYQWPVFLYYRNLNKMRGILQAIAESADLKQFDQHQEFVQRLTSIDNRFRDIQIPINLESYDHPWWKRSLPNRGGILFIASVALRFGQATARRIRLS